MVPVRRDVTITHASSHSVDCSCSQPHGVLGCSSREITAGDGMCMKHTRNVDQFEKRSRAENCDISRDSRRDSSLHV